MIILLNDIIQKLNKDRDRALMIGMKRLQDNDCIENDETDKYRLIAGVLIECVSKLEALK